MPDTALLVVDMQRALLKDAHDSEACLGRVAGLAERGRAAGAQAVRHNRVFSVPPAAEIRFDASPAD